MPAPGIRARFPLGVYIGHRPDGSPDTLPSTLRLHAALVASACTGSTAESDGARLIRSASSTRALEWLEDNPPDFVELPPCLENSPNDITFRDQGVVEGAGKGAPARKRSPRTFGSGTALAAAIGWGWEAIPEDVSAALNALCADVPCLGETDSAVVLEVGEINPTHRRIARPNNFGTVATRIPSPIRGRLAELDEQHAAARPAKPPTSAADRWTKTEEAAPVRPTHHSTVDIGYDLIEAEPPRPAPWDRVVHVAIDAEIGGLERVDWSVTMHRAMVKALDDEAASIVTGKYVRGVTPPANRVAIQPVDTSIMTLSTRPDLGPGILVLVPTGAGAVDDPMSTVARALSRITRLYRHGGIAIRLGTHTVLDARTFWKDPAPSTVRTWASVPAVVPETRRQRRGSRQWTLADSARLSLGFVFRDRFVVPDGVSANVRYAALADQVEAAGVGVLSTAVIPDADVSRYAHKLPAGVVAQPYRLHLRGGDLVPDSAILAIGQSRHLGGGLLVPVDVPVAVAEVWGVDG